jgi:hypothetical protein
MEKSPLIQKNYQYKFLDEEEELNPLIAIGEFFTANDLNGHKTNLFEWRACVIEDRYYKDSKGSPSGLLFSFKINMKLIESLHILLFANPLPDINSTEEFIADHVRSEKSSWKFYPTLLEQQEIVFPQIAISNFFKSYGLEELRMLLFEWLEFGLSIRGCEDFLSVKKVIYVYENLIKLYEAAWLIEERVNKLKHLELSDINRLSSLKRD